MTKHRIDEKANVSKESKQFALVKDVSTYHTIPRSSKSMPIPNQIDDFYGVCEYCGEIDIIVLDMDDRYACMGCLEARD